MGCSCSRDPTEPHPTLDARDASLDPRQEVNVLSDVSGATLEEASHAAAPAPRRTPTSNQMARRNSLTRPQLFMPPPMLTELGSSNEASPRDDTGSAAGSVISPPAPNARPPRAVGFDVPRQRQRAAAPAPLEIADSPSYDVISPRQGPKNEWSPSIDNIRRNSSSALMGGATAPQTKMVAQFEAMVRRVHYPDRPPAAAGGKTVVPSQP